MKNFFIPLVLAIILCFLIYHFEINPNVEFISSLYEISLIVSSILFGVLGIWLSSIYNEGLKNFLSENSNLKSKESSKEEIKRLLYPLFFSFIAVSVSLIYFTSLIFQEELKLIFTNKIIFKRLALFSYIFITLFQISFLTIIFEPLVELYVNIWFKSKVNKDNEQIFDRNKEKLK